MSISKIEASKNANIQARFDTKERGTKSRNYRLELTDGTIAHVIFSNGETLDDALQCLTEKYGDRVKHVS